MSYPRLVATLIFLATAFSLVGMASFANAGRNPWAGAVAGGFVVLFFGLAVRGMIRGRLLDVLFRPVTGRTEDEDEI